MNRSNLHQHLKVGTSDAHHQLDIHPRMRALFDSELTHSTYGALLEALSHWYQPLEVALARWLTPWSIALTLDLRKKYPLLMRDLHALGSIGSTEANRRSPAIPHFTSASAALGGLYVIEGATLGGQLIARQIRQTLKLTPETGAAFFHSYGPEVGPQWRTFIAFLEHCPPELSDTEATVAGAQATFQSIAAWLTYS